MACPCAGCGKTVFPAERQVLNGKVFHKNQGCAKCGKCGAKLTAKNFVSVSGDDPSLWLCNAPHGLTTSTVALKKASSIDDNESIAMKKMPPPPPSTVGRKGRVSSVKDRFAVFLKRSVQEEESRKLRALGPGATGRASVRKRVTKEALSEWSASRRTEIAAFIDALRKQEQTTSPPTTKLTGPLDSGNPMFVPSPVSPPTTTTTMTGWTPPTTASKSQITPGTGSTRPSPSPPNAQPGRGMDFKQPLPTGKTGFNSGRKALVSVSLKNIHVKDRINAFQKG